MYELLNGFHHYLFPRLQVCVCGFAIQSGACLTFHEYERVCFNPGHRIWSGPTAQSLVCTQTVTQTMTGGMAALANEGSRMSTTQHISSSGCDTHNLRPRCMQALLDTGLVQIDLLTVHRICRCLASTTKLPCQTMIEIRSGNAR